jgi:hypothetical protein
MGRFLSNAFIQKFVSASSSIRSQTSSDFPIEKVLQLDVPFEPVDVDARAFLEVFVQHDVALLLVGDDRLADSLLHPAVVDAEQPTVEVFEGEANRFLMTSRRRYLHDAGTFRKDRIPLDFLSLPLPIESQVLANLLRHDVPLFIFRDGEDFLSAKRDEGVLDFRHGKLDITMRVLRILHFLQYAVVHVGLWLVVGCNSWKKSRLIL